MLKRVSAALLQQVAAIGWNAPQYALALFCALLLSGSVIASAQRLAGIEISAETRNAVPLLVGNNLVSGSAMLKTADHWDEYQYLHAIGVLP
jgi:hypothetical protein